MTYCIPCERAFGSINALDQHLLDSPLHKHQYSRMPTSTPSANPKLSRKTDTSSRVLAAVSATASETLVEVSALSFHRQTEYRGEDPAAVAAVFAVAKQYRRQDPTPELIIQRTSTTLSAGIVRSIIEAAVRTVPSRVLLGGLKARQEHDRKRARVARQAEDNFLTSFKAKGFDFLDERKQKELAFARDQILHATPDVRFRSPELIAGHSCCWIEYKNYFGFGENPFIAEKEERQVRKYVSQIGPGLVVYSLGFEENHLCVDHVKVMRQDEVVQELALRENVQREHEVMHELFERLICLSDGENTETLN